LNKSKVYSLIVTICTQHDKEVNAMNDRVWQTGSLFVGILTDDAFTNCYIVKDEASGQVFVVDPYWIDLPLEELCQNGISESSGVVAFITHLHPDHCEGVIDLRAEGYSVTALAHERVATVLKVLSEDGGVDRICEQYNAKMFRGEIELMVGIRPEGLADGSSNHPHLGQVVTFCGEGHSPADSVLFLPEGLGCAFVGDLLAFDGTDVLFGRTDFPGGNRDKLMATVDRALALLPDNCLICPGHNEPFQLTNAVREMIKEQLGE